MKKYSIGSKMLSTLLVLAMTLSILPVGVFAAKGDLANVSTGLTGNIDTGDTISLPIKILDYENDGMLFEFAEATAGKSAADFGSKFFQVTETGGDIGNNTFDDVTVSLTTGTYATYVRLEYKGKTSNNWLGNNSGIYISTYEQKDDDNNWIGVLGKDLTDINDIQYVTIVYRSNVTSDNMYFAFGDNAEEADTSGRYTGAMPFKNTGYDGEGSETNWTFAVYDLKNGTLANNWGTSHPLISNNPNYFYIGLPLDSSGEWMDLAHVAFFSNADQAAAFGEYALTDGSDRGDNRGFGLLRGSRNQSGTVDFTGIDEVIGESVQMLNTYNATEKIDFATINGLGYKLLGEFGLNGIANVGLLESSIGENGYPVYKKAVVDYLANLLEDALNVPERTNGWKNYRYVKGSVSSIYGGTDLATALRNKINNTKGSYADASGKDLIGTWAEVGGNIASYYDAAYFLLNSIFVPNSYNEQQTDYNYLVLSAGTDKETNDKVYVFDGGFSTSATPELAQMAIDYDKTSHTIQNTSAAGKAHFYYGTTTTTTLFPFLPVTSDNTEEGMTKTPYYQDDGVINGVKKQTTKDTLYKHDFNFAMVSEGEFVYHADDELFFEFEGDDDVYLFINNELVMDIGSAHSIDVVRFELNDYVNAAKAGNLGSAERNEALALAEGETYSFKFYYMERHSYGSNIRICTNIRVTDPSMTTAKTAWQDGVQLDFGSVVDKDKVVEYGFAITNNGEENLHNLTFKDNDIGVTLDPTNGLDVTGTRVFDVNGGTLTASDLTAVVSHPDYADINITFDDNAGLKDFLRDFTAEEATVNDEGLPSKATVSIRGIGYKLSEEQIEAGVFDNTVLTTSTNRTGSKTLQGQASMRVFVPADPMYYEWAGKDLKVTKAKLIEDVLAAANTEGNLLAGKVPNLSTSNVNKIELVTKSGTAITSPYVTIDSSYNLTINYPTAGSKVFYVKVTYSGSNVPVIVPVLVNVAAVQDSVIVLDYGLPVDISVAELAKNDVLVVPGRNTTYEILGFGTDGAYSPNEITFTMNETATEHTGTYGTFKLNDDKSITYTPNKFIEGVDTIQIAYTVYETDSAPSRITGDLDINNEVEMYKTITIVPANVMYYEDDFDGIEYTGEANIEYATETTASLRQSADQNIPYGYDPVYADIKNIVDAEISGGSLHKIALDGSDIFTFTFIGTGFELIAQTNATDSGTIVVDKGAPEVEDDEPAPTSESGETGESALSDAAQLEVLVESTPVVSPLSMSGESLFAAAPSAQTKLYPVIMEFDNGANGGNEAITQVPVIRIDDMDWAIHTVTVKGIQANKYTTDASGKVSKEPIETYLYFDGLRIFEPLETDVEKNIYVGNEYYNVNEQSAQFKEIRDLVMTGYVGLATETDGEYKVATEKSVITWTENYSNESNKDEEVTKEEIAVNRVESIDEYLIKGPNNEVYMIDDTTSGLKSALFFFVDGNTVTENAQVQVAVRALDLGLFYGANSDGLHAEIQYSILENEVQKWQKLELIQSGTEQYYTIDVKNCPVDEKTGNYMVMLRIVNEDGTYGMVSYSSLKLTGGAALYKGWTVELDGTFNEGIYDSGVNGESNASSKDGNSVKYLITAQLRSDLVVTGPVNRFPTTPTPPAYDDPFQNLPDTNPDDTDDPETDDNTSDEDAGEDKDESRPDNFDLLKLFSLTAIAGEGGKITPEGELVIAFGASRTFRFIPDEGYEIANVLVNGRSVGAVETYVLKAAHADTVVEVIFREIPEAVEEETAAEEAAG